MWFESLMGFREQNPTQVRSLISVSNGTMTSSVTGKCFVCGHLETPALAELRVHAACAFVAKERQLRVRELVGDVQELHQDPENAGALFQVASQFNLLEMISPSVEPENGVDCYERDRTQGPACAIAAGAGTIYRNYFAEVNGRFGQTRDNQIDCSADLGDALGNAGGRLWKMQNGYLLPTPSALTEIQATLAGLDQCQLNDLRGALRVGVQHNTEVTIGHARHLVTQVYCSALPVAYTSIRRELWSAFAHLVLDAAYEATLAAAVQNFVENGNPRVYLTLLGGGAFGNSFEWILAALDRALRQYQHMPLDVVIVSYGSSNAGVRDLMEAYR